MGTQPILPKGAEPHNFWPTSIVAKRLVWIKMPLRMQVGLSLRDIVVIWGPSCPPLKGHSSQFSAHVYCGQTAGWIKMALGMEVGLSPGNFVLDGDPAHPPERGGAPQFSAHVYCGQTACMDQDATWNAGRPRPTRHSVIWGPSSPPLKGHSSRFSAHVYCGQTAGWTKMPLGMEVGLGPGDFVFDGFQLPSEKRHTHPTQFLAHVYCGQMAGWVKTLLGAEVDLGSGHIVLDGGPSSRERGTAAPPPVFGLCLLWPRSPISGTAELLLRYKLKFAIKTEIPN